MSIQFRPRKIGRVIKDYSSEYPDPLLLTEGETVNISKRETEWSGFVWCINLEGKGGWVPEDYLVHDGDVGILRCDYSAAELDVSVGENLILQKQKTGWYWGTNQDGKSGWVPADYVEVVE